MENIIIQIVSIFLASIITVLSYHYKNKSERDKAKANLELEKLASSNRDKLLRDELSGINNLLFEIKDDVTIIKRSHEDEFILSSTISDIILESINYNDGLDPFLKSLITNYGLEFEKFSNRWRTNIYRGTQHKMVQFIRIEIDGIINRTKAFQCHVAPKTRVYGFGSGKDKVVDFCDFMDASPAFKELDKLIVQLEKNGLETTEDIVEVFSEHISNFIRSLCLSLQEWSNLKLPHKPLPYEE